MYSVWFRNLNCGDRFCFMGSIPSESLAARIALNLVYEEFVYEAWIEKY